MNLPLRWRTHAGILAWLLAGLGVSTFFHLGGEIGEGETRGFDRAILLAFRVPGDFARPIGPPWLAEVARDLTALGSTDVLAIVVVGLCGYLLLVRQRRAAWTLALTLIGASILSESLKRAFDRPRPTLVPHETLVYSASFPSGHAMLSAVTYLTIGALIMRLPQRRAAKVYVLGVAILITVLVGVSRVFLGVHWPTDVVGGWCIGAAWALGAALLSEGGRPGALPLDPAKGRAP